MPDSDRPLISSRTRCPKCQGTDAEPLGARVVCRDCGIVDRSAVRRPGRGFAAMSPEERRELGRKGGRTSARHGTAHRWTAEEARAAGLRSAASPKTLELRARRAAARATTNGAKR